MQAAHLGFVILAAFPGAVSAQSLPPQLVPPDPAPLRPYQFPEVRLGVLARDVSFAGGVEPGADFNLEITSSTLVDPAWGDWAPLWAQWVLHPRAHAGVEVNTSGATNQAYAGLTWTARLTEDVFGPGDAIEFSYLFGPSINDGRHRSRGRDRKSLGSNVLFHLGAEIAYRITPEVAVGAYFDHSSNAGLARSNGSLNDAGLRVALRF